MSKTDLTLRKITLQDYKLWNKEVWQGADDREDEFKHFVQKITAEEQQDRSYSFIVDLAGRTIGFIQLFEVLRHPSFSGKVEIFIFEKERGKGYGKKSVQLLEAFCFETLKLKKIIAPISPDNDASLSMFKALHYERVFLDPYAFFLDGKPAPHEIYVKLGPS